MLVLLVEDETDLAELTIDFLNTVSIECDYAYDGLNALNLIKQNHYDLIILDVEMPRLDGFSLCKQLRKDGISTPILFLSARDSLADKLEGFNIGADDYLTKPFELEELAARIQLRSKRNDQPLSNAEFLLDTLTINHQQRSVIRAGKTIALSPTQWQLLILLAKNSPNVVTHQTIENEIWPDQEPSKDMLKTLVFRLRRLIDNEQETPLVHTIRGAGFALRV